MSPDLEPHADNRKLCLVVARKMHQFELRASAGEFTVMFEPRVLVGSTAGYADQQLQGSQYEAAMAVSSVNNLEVGRVSRLF
jgi:hypothetical protein